jgi:hypothetical protein
MNATGLVTDKVTLSFLNRECEKIIDTQKRLPDFVFRRSFSEYCAIEYGHIYRREFGAFLLKLSDVFGDEFVNYMALDPDPRSYRGQFSYFGAASFKPSDLLERYVAVLSRDDNVPQILAGVNVGAFWGSSLKWAISCDRISWEIAVVAVSENVDVPTMSGFRCMDADGVSSYMRSQYHWKPPAASDFTQRFLANYAI